VSALMETGANVEGVRTAIDLDAGFALLKPEVETEIDTRPEPIDENEVRNIGESAAGE
jgi:hypothetical protein